MSYYIMAWVESGTITLLETDENPITENHSPETRSETIISAVASGEYRNAGEIIGSLSITGGKLHGIDIESQVSALNPRQPLSYAERLASARASATLTRREFFLGLDAMGIYDTVMAAELPRAARIELDTATSFDRTWPTLVEMAHSLGFTDEQLDALFGIEVTP